MISQNPLSAERITVPDNVALRLAQTMFSTSYSTALSGSSGRLEPSGVGSSESDSSSYSDSSSVSASSDDSSEDEDSAAEAAREVPEYLIALDAADLGGLIFSFLTRGLREASQGPLP